MNHDEIYYRIRRMLSDSPVVSFVSSWFCDLLQRRRMRVAQDASLLPVPVRQRLKQLVPLTLRQQLVHVSQAAAGGGAARAADSTTSSRCWWTIGRA